MAFQDKPIRLEESGETVESRDNICSVPRGEGVRDLIAALFDISDKTFEDDQKSIKWQIGRGWEEAVCGWGSLSPNACLFPQKKSKKPKAAAGSSSCLLCSDLCQVAGSKNVTLETKTTTDSNLKERAGSEHLVADNAPPAEKGLPCRYTDNCSDVVSKTETHCDQASPRGMFHTVQKQCRQQSLGSSTSPCRVKEASAYHTTYRDSKDSLPNDSAVILPPLKIAGNRHSDHTTQIRKDILMQGLDKFPTKSFLGNVLTRPLHSRGLQGEQRLIDAIDPTREQLKEADSESFIPKTPSKDGERLFWQCSFLSQKPSTTIPISTITVRQNAAPVGILQTRTMHNKRNVKHHEAKLRGRAQSGNTPLLTGPLLPSLTVTRVEIPVATHRHL